MSRHSPQRINPEGRAEYDRMAQAVLFACWIAPLVSWILLLAFGWRARFQLGHWPGPDDPDAARLGWTTQHTFTWLALLGSGALLFVAMFVALFFTWYDANRRWKNSLATALIAGLWLASLSIPKAANLLEWIVG